MAGGHSDRRTVWQENGVAGGQSSRRMGCRNRGALPPHRGSKARPCGSGRDRLGVTASQIPRIQELMVEV